MSPRTTKESAIAKLLSKNHSAANASRRVPKRARSSLTAELAIWARDPPPECSLSPRLRAFLRGGRLANAVRAVSGCGFGETRERRLGLLGPALKRLAVDESPPSGECL